MVQTVYHGEALAKASLFGLGFGVYFPQVWREAKPAQPGVRRHKRFDEGRFVFAFPRYGFVQFCLDTDPWRKIVTTRGVSRLFSMTPERPVAVPGQAMAALKARLADQGKAAASEDILEGAPVRITAGPFEGHDAICTSAKVRKDAIRVLLLHYGREIEVMRNMVEPVK